MIKNQTAAERTQPIRTYYGYLLEEIIFGVESLTHSQPLNPMSSTIMTIEKRTTLAQIDELTGFLELARSQVEQVNIDILP